MIEEWKSVKDFEGLYEVSNLGNIRSLPRPSRPGKGGWPRPGILLSLIAHHKGYLCVNLMKNGVRKRKQVAMLVAESFIPNPFNKPIANHINGKEKHNNRVDNLEWATISENTQHAYDTGLMPKTRNRKKAVSQ